MHGYVGVLTTALFVLLLGAGNPRIFQSVKNGQHTGCPNYLLVALIAGLAGLIGCFLTASYYEPYRHKGYQGYLAVLITVLMVLLLGCSNPQVLQTKKDSVLTGCPNYMLVALIAGIVGLVSCFLVEGGHSMYQGYAPYQGEMML